jgi:hypothetical protein
MLTPLALLLYPRRIILADKPAGIPSAPHEIQKLFLLKLCLIGGNVRTVELYEPVAFDVLLHFYTRQLAAGPFQNLGRQHSGARNGMLGEVGFDATSRGLIGSSS